MSKFSEYLKYLVERNGQSVSALSRECKVERTSIHKAITGERPLSYKSTRKLGECLRLSPQEMQLLMEYHNMQMQGEAIFETRQQIVQLLKVLSDLPPFTVFEKRLAPPHFENPGFPSGQQIYSGEFSVRTIIRRVIDQELGVPAPSMQMNLPNGDSFLLNYIYTVYQQYATKMEITHIIPYRATQENANAVTGLSILKDVLSLSLSAGVNYSPYFYYDRESCFADPFPYYLLTSSCLLCISGDFGTVLHLTAPDIMAHYRNFFAQTLKLCSPLLRFQKDPFEILEAYSRTTSKTSYYTFMPQPCMGRFYSPALIARKLHRELPFYQQLVDKSIQRFSMLRDITGHYYTFFSRRGLENFMADGIICDIPRALISPLTPSERLDLVRRLRDDTANDSITSRIVNEERITLPRNLSFCISEKKEVDIFTLQSTSEEEEFYNIHISEPLIAGAFLDFILFLPKSNLVLGKEETLAFLDELIASMD